MNYSAKKIYVTCSRTEIDAWVTYMKAHPDEVRQSLMQERVKHEAWYLGEDNGGLYLIGIMDVDDQASSASIAASSTLSVDQVHQVFKQYWDRAKIIRLEIPPDYQPNFDGCDVLLDVRA